MHVLGVDGGNTKTVALVARFDGTVVGAAAGGNVDLGGLRAGAPDGVGVSVVCGTGGAVGGRGRDGHAWHASFWLGSGGAIELVRQALQTVWRSTLAIDPPTSLATVLPRLFGATSPASLLHLLTCRESLVSAVELASAAPSVLDAAADGDPSASQVVVDGGVVLADYALAAARHVDLLEDPTGFPLVLAGGLLRHSSSLLADTIVRRVTDAAPGAKPVFTDLPPVAGSLLLALDSANEIADGATQARLRTTIGRLDSVTLAWRGRPLELADCGSLSSSGLQRP